MNKKLAVLYSRKSDLWRTPSTLFTLLDSEFHFDLDPCCLKESALCDIFYTPLENGLKQDWSGHRVFCNPPYSDITAWVKKCYFESRKPNTLVVMLIPARTDTAYFHDWIYGRAELRFIRGRLHFNDEKGAAPFPSVIVIFNSPFVLP